MCAMMHILRTLSALCSGIYESRGFALVDRRRRDLLERARKWVMKRYILDEERESWGVWEYGVVWEAETLTMGTEEVVGGEEKGLMGAGGVCWGWVGEMK